MDAPSRSWCRKRVIAAIPPNGSEMDEPTASHIAAAPTLDLDRYEAVLFVDGKPRAAGVRDIVVSDLGELLP